jgi:hypothetical protein
VEGIKTETAIIALDEDTSINAAPQEEYELAQVSGDKERIEEVFTILMRRLRDSWQKPSRSGNVRY